MKTGGTIPKIEELELTAPDAGGEADQTPGALRLAVVGVGQCGNNLAEAAYAAGLRRVGAINSNTQDMAKLTLPRKLRLGETDDGAGKDTAVGYALADRRRKDIADFLRAVCGKSHDRLLLACGAGGGTGAGAFPVLLDCARMVSVGARKDGEPVVGAILVLPGSGGGYRAKANTLRVLRQALAAVDAGTLSPLILVDNARMQHLATVLRFFPTVNRHVINQLLRFNIVASHASGVAQFDGRDLASILDSGVVTFGITKVADAGGKDAIGRALRDNFARNVLLDADIGGVTHAGAVFVGGSAVFDDILQEELEDGLASLNRLIAAKSVLHHGIYVDEAEPGLTVATMLGGLGAPAAYLAGLEREVDG